MTWRRAARRALEDVPQTLFSRSQKRETLPRRWARVQSARYSTAVSAISRPPGLSAKLVQVETDSGFAAWNSQAMLSPDGSEQQSNPRDQVRFQEGRFEAVNPRVDHLRNRVWIAVLVLPSLQN